MCEKLPVMDRIKVLAVHGKPEGGETDEAKVFCYSEGMVQFERPDLLVRDVPPFLTLGAMRFLNIWCQYLADGGSFVEGETLGDGRTYRVRVRPAPKNWRANPYGLLELVADAAHACEKCGEGHDHPGDF